MPSSAKIFAALLLALTGAVCTQLMADLLARPQNTSLLFAANIAVGALVGWHYIGARVRADGGGAIILGLNGALVHMMVILLGSAGVEMISWSFRRRYDDVIEALVDVFVIGFGYMGTYMTLPVVICAIIGGVLSSKGAVGAYRKWG